MRYDDNGDAETAVDVGYELENRVCGLRVERTRRLVAKQYARIGRKRTRNGYSLLLTARELCRIGKRLVRQLYKLKQLARTLFRVGARHPRKTQRKADISKTGALHEQVKALEYHRYLTSNGTKLALSERADIHTVDIYGAGGRALEHIDAANERTFARAAHAYDAVDISVVYREIYIIKCLDGTFRRFKGL